MDVLFFLRERTKFIRYFYETAAEPFRETIRKIEADEAPFDNPPYSEDGEPPFLEEWMILFIGFWIYCIAAYGFFFGVALGWLPSGIAATVASFLWPLIALAVGFLVWGIFFW